MMIAVFQQAIDEALLKIEQNRASARPRRQASAECMQRELDACIERLFNMPDDLQSMIAYSLQNSNGGLLFLIPTDTAWHIEAAYHAGDQFYAVPMTYKSIL